MKKIYLLFIFGMILGIPNIFSQSTLVHAEYFLDNDPGVGNATPLTISTGDSTTKTFQLPTTNLSFGYHKLAIRVRNADNLWSIIKDEWIYIINNTTISQTVSLPQLVIGEYFFDNDPGVGSGNSIAITQGDSVTKTIQVSTAGLSIGYHKILFRVKNVEGLWSIGLDNWIYVIDTTSISQSISLPQLVVGEYFFDTDPGVGNANTITFTQGDSITKALQIATSGLSAGFHNLLIRVKNEDGLWSIALDNSIHIIDTSSLYIDKTPSQLISAEYFIDNDPGPGNGSPLTITAGDSITWTGDINTDTLSSGLYKLSIRSKNLEGLWSIAMTDTFRIADCIQPTANFSASDACIGDTVFLTNQSSNTDTNVSYYWDINNDGTYDLNSLGDTFYIYQTANSYDIKLMASNSNCPDSIVKNIEVSPMPTTNVTIYGSGTICPGSTISMGAYPGLGYSFQWIKDGTAVPNATNALYLANSNGDYLVKVTSFEGCIDTSSTSTISMYSLPAADITAQGEITFCHGDSVALNASIGTDVSYLWYKNGTALLTDTLFSYTATEPGSYKVQLTSTTGCNDESSPVIVSVNPLPIVNLFALGSTSFCYGDSVELQTNTGTDYQYEWYKDDIVIASALTNSIEVDTNGNYSVKITDANQCIGTSSNATVIAFETPTSDFILPIDVCSSDTTQIQYNGTGTAAAFYNWNFDGASIHNGTNIGPYGVQWNTAGIKQVELTVSENGCSSTTTMYSTNVHTVTANLSSASSAVCQGDSVLLFANSGQNYTYQWLQNGLNINNANATILAVLQTGNYSVRITDTILGCSQISQTEAVNIYPTDFSLAFSANNTTFTQPPFDVAISNETANLSNYQFDWDLGDGNTSTFYNPGYSYQYNGDYTVKLYAENTSTGCRDTLIKTDYIICNGGAPNPCNILAAISPAGPTTICNGDSFLLTANVGSGYNYQWAYNYMIISGATSETFYAKQAGNYRVIVSDDICSQTSPAFVLNHYPSIPPQIMVNGNIQPCTDDSLELYLPTSYVNYNWNVGDTNSSIFVQQSGYYTVEVQDYYGCTMVSQPQTVNASFLQPPNVCIVGVDTDNHNRIIWERPANALIDSIFVYRESNVSNQYNIIGKLDYSEAGIFSDINSNPAIRAYRYRLGAKDTCGATTLLSTYHKTIHLTINAGINGSWNLIWDGYTGFQFGSYRIYRGTSTSTMSLLTQLSSTSISYTDLNPPTGQVYYQIEVVKIGGCFPDSLYSKVNTNYNSSRSNTASSANMQPIYLTADFDVDALTGIWPIQVAFTDISSGNPDNWHWNFGDGNTSVEQHPVHTFNNTGVYTVSLIACNGSICDTTQKIDYIEVLPNGLVEIGVNMSAKLYPNPNDGNFTLEIDDKASHNLQLHIYNAIGEDVYQESFVSKGKLTKNINLNRLSNGVYFLHLNTKDSVVYRTKVVISK